MRTVELILDEALLEEVDRVAHSLGTTRSSFIRDALLVALGRLEERQLEDMHRSGYARHPVRPGEVAGWDTEQVWGD